MSIDVHRMLLGFVLSAVVCGLVWHVTVVVSRRFRLFVHAIGRPRHRGRWRKQYHPIRGCDISYAEGDLAVHGAVVYVMWSWRWWRPDYTGKADDFHRRNMQHGNERWTSRWRRWETIGMHPDEGDVEQSQFERTITRALNPRQNIQRPEPVRL